MEEDRQLVLLNLLRTNQVRRTVADDSASACGFREKCVALDFLDRNFLESVLKRSPTASPRLGTSARTRTLSEFEDAFLNVSGRQKGYTH